MEDVVQGVGGRRGRIVGNGRDDPLLGGSGRTAVIPSREASPSLEALRNRVEAWVEEALRRSAGLGLLGSMPIRDQIDHALGFVYATEQALPEAPGTVVDLGSGGGVPGLVLASCWPVSHFLFIDSNERRSDFLSAEVTGRADTDNVEVIRARVEEAGRLSSFRQQCDLVTSRSFGAPAVAAECGAPFLAVGGLMVVSEPPDSGDGARWPSQELAQLGLEPSTRVRFEDLFGYQVLTKTHETPDRYPRRVGIPAKRPLF